MSGEVPVRLDQVEKTFRTRHVLEFDEEAQRRRIFRRRVVHAARQISFTVNRGEVFGLLGPNGAGKTTTVKMISGLVRPDSGAVYVDGMDVEKKRTAVLRQVGVVLEGTRTSIWPLTPMENLIYYGNLKNVRGRVVKQRANELLDFIGLNEKKNVQVRYLSRGQKQKLAICIALIGDPQVILLDEPTTGLDVESSRAIKDKILEMTRSHGKSVLVTTHDMHTAQELCGRIGIINNGELVACKPTEELLDLFSDQVFVFKVDRLPPLDGFEGLQGVVRANADEAVDGPEIAVTVASDAENRSAGLYAVVEQLRREGVRLIAINQRQQNLESVFLKITSKNGGEAGA